ASVPSAPDAAACGNGLDAYAAAVGKHAFAQRIADIPGPHARHVAQLAQESLARNETVAAKEGQPLYLRNKVALTTLERQAKLSVWAPIPSSAKDTPNWAMPACMPWSSRT